MEKRLSFLCVSSGDDRGTLHVSELLLRIYLASGDVGSALNMGPKVKSYAERVGMTDMRVRAVALTGVAAFRRGNVEAASRCFRELPEGALSPLTSAMMWRLGEAIALHLRIESADLLISVVGFQSLTVYRANFRI